MGLDMSIIQTNKSDDLSAIYAIVDALRENFDWYLGNGDAKSKKEKYDEMMDKFNKITRQEIIDLSSEYDDNVQLLKDMSDNDFMRYMVDIGLSIRDFNEHNSHFGFAYENLPGTNLYDSCSWKLRDLLFDYATNERKPDDSVVELNHSKLMELNDKYKRYSRKLKFIKYIGFFMPNVAYRMFDDFIDMNFGDSYLELNEIIYHADVISGIVKKSNREMRLWMISSY